MLQEAATIAVETGELLDDVRAHVAVLLLDLLGRLERRVWLATVSEKRLDEVGDIAASNRNRLDRRTDYVALSHRDNVSNTVTRIDNCARQGPVLDFGRGPRRRQRQHGLYGNVETCAVERLEEDLSSVFSVLGGVQRLPVVLAQLVPETIQR